MRIQADPEKVFYDLKNQWGFRVSGSQRARFATTCAPGEQREAQRVNGIVPARSQLPRQTARQLRVHHEFHAATGSMLLIRLNRAAYAMAACRSAISRSE